jgi:hypothetical protein
MAVLKVRIMAAEQGVEAHAGELSRSARTKAGLTDWRQLSRTLMDIHPICKREHTKSLCHGMPAGRSGDEHDMGSRASEYEDCWIVRGDNYKE